MLLLSVCLVGLAAGAGFAGGGDEPEAKIKLADCPAAVQETLKREAFGGKLDDIEKETENGRVSYEADVKIDGHNYEIVVDDKGMLVHKLLDEDDEDEQETEMKLADCPPAVQKTLKREAGEAKIDKVDKQQQQGRTVYETDVKLGGENYEIVVTEEGLLLAKQLDEDDEEEEDDKNEKKK
jgi:uncharacterized membrane protein YkoI